jgi:hypothetical protein
MRAARGRRSYDLAALATFLHLDAEAAHGLLALQEQAPLAAHRGPAPARPAKAAPKELATG